MPDHAHSLDDIEIPSWDERRGTVRRADDRSLLAKCRAMANDVSKLLGIVVILCGALAAVAGVMGLRIAGPTQDIAAIATRQDSLDRRVGRLEVGSQATQRQIGELANDVQFLSYQFCIRDNGSDRVALKRCQPLIHSFRSEP